jgi:hypothetical protein
VPGEPIEPDGYGAGWLADVFQKQVFARRSAGVSEFVDRTRPLLAEPEQPDGAGGVKGLRVIVIGVVPSRDGTR